MLDLFRPPKPPEVKPQDVSVTHVFMNTEPKYKLSRTYYVARTAEQKARRRWLSQEVKRTAKRLEKASVK